MGLHIGHTALEGKLHPLHEPQQISNNQPSSLQGTGLRASAADLGTTDLLKRASRSLDRAVVDDVHAMSHHTSSLMSLIHKVQSGPPATTGAATTTSTSRPGGAAQSGGSVSRAADATGAPQQPVPDAAAPSAANLPPMNAANAGTGEAPAQEQGMFAGSAAAAGGGGSGGGLFDPMFDADALAEDWANWLSVGLDGMDGGSFGFDFYPGAGSGDFSAPG